MVAAGAAGIGLACPGTVRLRTMACWQGTLLGGSARRKTQAGRGADKRSRKGQARCQCDAIQRQGGKRVRVGRDRWSDWASGLLRGRTGLSGQDKRCSQSPTWDSQCGRCFGCGRKSAGLKIVMTPGGTGKSRVSSRPGGAARATLMSQIYQIQAKRTQPLSNKQQQTAGLRCARWQGGALRDRAVVLVQDDGEMAKSMFGGEVELCRFPTDARPCLGGGALVLSSKNCVIARQPTALGASPPVIGCGEVSTVSGPNIIPDGENPSGTRPHPRRILLSKARRCYIGHGLRFKIWGLNAKVVIVPFCDFEVGHLSC
jgi:hypothetical protein